MDVVAALLVEDDAGGEVQRVTLLLTACAQQNAGRADLLGVVGDDVAVFLGQQLIAGGGLLEEAVEMLTTHQAFTRLTRHPAMLYDFNW